MFTRTLNPIKTRSFMLFGARGTGKSTYLTMTMPKSSYWIDLLNLDLEAKYLAVKISVMWICISFQK
jgi:predicted kinase